uniref:Glucosamine-6-phosphate isomerase 1-like n=1 Tax=Phascolarctos cinereus TaxID=38626 RepID=A0A6P5LXK6_PHACI|nr:glucosamine-6-phosphate isomerase 1-like [Phascolarctos cinereus]
MSFKYMKTFNMDEYVGLPHDYPESFYSFKWNNFFKHADTWPENTHLLDGNAADLEAECAAFEETTAGGIELFAGGAGLHAHNAFNELGLSLESRTLVKPLAMDTTLAKAKFFKGDLSKGPPLVLTVVVATVMDPREVMVPIMGTQKAPALYMANEEGINHMWTVSALQKHSHMVFVCEEDATLELKGKTVKCFKGLMHVHNKPVEPLYSMKEKETDKSQSSKKPYSD